MRRALPGVTLLLCALLGACGSDETRVTQDLTTTRRGFTDGRPVTVSVEGTDVERRLTATGPGVLDVTVRAPEAGTLRYSLPPDLPPAVVKLAVAGGGTVTPLAPVQQEDGIWRASLPVGGGLTDLQLSTATGRPISLIAPRIEGGARRTPPILPPDVRRPRRPPNVILYVADTLRADRMSLYGYHRPTSPSLDRLAERALVFDRAYAAGSFTTPSVTSLLSSRYPEELLGSIDRDGPARETLAETFQAAGYETAAFQANVLCTPALGYDRGFDHYQLLGSATPDGVDKVPAAALHAAALDWMRTRLDRPFFVYLQSMDVHFPYAPPAPFRELFPPPAPDAKIAEDILAQLRKTLDEAQIRVFFDRLGNMSPDRYDGALAYADHEIGVLFDALARLGLADDTIIVLTADHGEPLGDRGEMLHGRSLYEELVRVPLVLWVPGIDGGVRIDEVVSHLDLGATLLDLAGIPVPKSFVGRSWLAPGTSVRPPGAVGELLAPPSHKAVAWFAREGPWKLVLDAKGAQLFHLPTDPGETQDVSAANPEVARYLVGRATARPWSAATSRPSGAGLTEEQRREREEALRALGYVH